MRIKTVPWVLLLLTLVVGTTASAQQFAWFTNESSGGYLGVSMRDVTAEDVPKAKLEAEGGVWVTKVSPDSPAAAAGIETDDVIIGYAGSLVTSTMQFRRLVQETPPGRSVALKVMRKGQVVALTAAIGKREAGDGPLVETFERDLRRPLPEEGLPRFHFRADPESRAFPRELHAHAERWMLGVSAIPLTKQMGDFLKVEGEGALVLEVVADSPAAKAGIRAGDVIVEVNGEAVTSPETLKAELKAGANTIQLIRGGSPQSVTADLEGADAHGVIRGERM